MASETMLDVWLPLPLGYLIFDLLEWVGGKNQRKRKIG